MNLTGYKSRDMLGRSQTVSLAAARNLLLQHMPPCPARIFSVSLEDSLERVCAAAVRSPENLPPYPRSTMDGYAVRARDTFGATENLPAYLEVSGEVTMGRFPEKGPDQGACYSIATGGILPPGTDAVVMLEHTVPIDAGMIEVIQPVASGSNVIAAGEDIAENELLLPAGHRIRPQDIGLLAGVGLNKISVFDEVRVGIISTGDEIVPYDQPPPPGKIRDMNGAVLAALVRKNHGRPVLYGIVSDDEKSLTAKVQQAKAANDIVLLSGSSSVGARDLGEKVLEELGRPGIIFHGVSVKPGKPVILARAGDTLLFGLPGHPVSAAVSFDLFVRPAIIGLSGATASNLPQQRTVKARLRRNINSASGRTDFVRVRVNNAQDGIYHEAHPILGRSGAISTMVKAHGYIEIAEKLQGLREGEIVTVVLFD